MQIHPAVVFYLLIAGGSGGFSTAGMAQTFEIPIEGDVQVQVFHLDPAFANSAQRYCKAGSQLECRTPKVHKLSEIWPPLKSATEMCSAHFYFEWLGQCSCYDRITDEESPLIDIDKNNFLGAPSL